VDKHLKTAQASIITILILILSCTLIIYDFDTAPLTRDWAALIVAEFCLQILYTNYNKT